MCLILADSVAEPTLLQTIWSYAWMILSVGAGLTFVIFVHELGHFLVAKACGVKCEKFYIGFDFFEFKLGPIKIPRSLIKFQWGETEYGLGSLPLGGYVKMLGQDDDPRNAEAEAARSHLPAEAEPGQPAVEGKTTEGKPILLDPRSYPAKSVPARMAIISAGVIMNLIFGVILGAVAYKLGVKEIPAEIGIVAPGSPAWASGIQPGGKIIQIGRSGSEYDQLRFTDLTSAVILNGYDRDLALLIREPDGQKNWHELRPTDRLKKTQRRPSVGLGPQTGPEVRTSSKHSTHQRLNATPELKDRDKVIAIGGQEIRADSDIQTLLAQSPSGPLTLKVERRPEPKDGSKPDAEKESPPQILDVVVQPKPIRELGLTMKIGPVVALRKGSPAEEAGFLVGDTLVEINGQPIGDPVTLPDRLAEQWNDAPMMEIVVLRDGAAGKPERKILSVAPTQPTQSHDSFWSGGPTAIETIGLAYSVTHTVESVAAGSAAAKAGLKPGDVVTQIEIPRRGGEAKEFEEDLRNELLEPPLKFDPFKPIVLDDNARNWLLVQTLVQDLLPEHEVKVTWTRGGKSQSALLQPSDSTTAFDPDRGLAFYGKVHTHKALSWGEAFQLGFREVYDKLREVLGILQSLVTGRLSPTNLSGPAGIIYAAGSFASEGISSLLMFLVMLSANLAILNFLPIPALDGGHMLFLTAEAIRGKPVDEKLQVRLTVLGVVCLLSLMVFATAMDIGRFAEMLHNWFS